MVKTVQLYARQHLTRITLGMTCADEHCAFWHNSPSLLALSTSRNQLLAEMMSTLKSLHVIALLGLPSKTVWCNLPIK